MGLVLLGLPGEVWLPARQGAREVPRGRVPGVVLEGLFQPEGEGAHQVDVPEERAAVPSAVRAPVGLPGGLLLVLADGGEAGVGGRAGTLALVEAVFGEVSVNAAAAALPAVTGDVGAVVELVGAGGEGLRGRQAPEPQGGVHQAAARWGGVDPPGAHPVHLPGPELGGLQEGLGGAGCGQAAPGQHGRGGLAQPA